MAAAPAVQSFFEQYRTTFARFDRDALVELFVFPLQLVSATKAAPSVSVVDRNDWPALLDGLFEAYRVLGVTGAEPLELATLDVASDVVSARVHWELRREDGGAIYDFTAIYTLADVSGSFRIAGIAHDELPKLEAALNAM